MPGFLAAKLPYPAAAIKAQFVGHLGKAWLLGNGKLQRGEDNRHRVYLGYEIAPYGGKIKNPKAIWTGPVIKPIVTEAELFPGGSDDLEFRWEEKPIEISFPQNRFHSEWISGDEAINKGYIGLTPEASLAEYKKRGDRSWCYRFVIFAVDLDSFHVVLEAVPASIKEMQGCEWGNTLHTGACRIDFWEAKTGNVTRPDCGEGFIPFLQDDRLPKYNKESLIPSSKVVRGTVALTLQDMAKAHCMSEVERTGYKPGENRFHPEIPDIPELDEDVEQPPVKRARTQGMEGPRTPANESPGKRRGVGTWTTR